MSLIALLNFYANLHALIVLRKHASLGSCCYWTKDVLAEMVNETCVQMTAEQLRSLFLMVVHYHVQCEL